MTTAERSAAADRLIVALDFPARLQALEFVASLEGQCRWLKIGLELFVAEGPRLVHELRDAGFEIFLDLKLHDIPNTVQSAIRAVAGLRPSLLTVHALGGARMLSAAQASVVAHPGTRLLAVTVLTSMDRDQLNEVGVEASPAQEVARLGRLAVAAGIPGLVCSPDEIVALRSDLGSAPLLIVPGIRQNAEPGGGVITDDQKRVATAQEAISRGASKIVVGRPITRAADPARAMEAVIEDIVKGMQQGPDSQAS